MRKHMLDRRQVLGLGLGVGAAGIAAAGTAQAFQLQEMGPKTEQLYRLACEAPAKHVQLLAEIDAQLEGKRLGDDEIRAIKARTVCPLCGCPLGAADADAKPDPAL